LRNQTGLWPGVKKIKKVVVKSCSLRYKMRKIAPENGVRVNRLLPAVAQKLDIGVSTGKQKTNNNGGTYEV